MKVERHDLGKNISAMKREGYNYLAKITAVDYMDHVDVLYFFRNLSDGKDVELEVSLDPSDLWASLCPIELTPLCCL